MITFTLRMKMAESGSWDGNNHWWGCTAGDRFNSCREMLGCRSNISASVGFKSIENDFASND